MSRPGDQLSDDDQLKAMLVACLLLAREADAETDPIGRRLAHEHMTRAILASSPLITVLAADLMVS